LGNPLGHRLNFLLGKNYTDRNFSSEAGDAEAKEVLCMKDKIIDIKKGKKKRVLVFRIVEDECIWMKAGVVNFRLCENAFDCYNCPFDQGMQRAMSSGSPSEIELKEPDWVKYLKTRYPGAERPCRHVLTGRVDAPKICPLNYECYHCAFDQMMDEIDVAELSEPPRYALASGYKMARGYYYHSGHCWVRFDHGGRARVGFDDFMVKLFGTFQFLSFPPLGATIKKDQPGLTIGRSGRKAALLSPVTGTVIAVNHKALDYPEILHEDPYNEGWLCIIEPDMPKKNLKGLYFGKDSIQWMEQESRQLLNLMGPEYKQLAATGAQPISDVFGNFPELEWDQLVKTFLRTGPNPNIS
jgi:glycine cleavage system H lipoate-binding protein